ncbi:hypothetical protein [Paenibacillus cucumis (ex Kampfer et al. 2016)]|uniref:Uncharacterized protein n=1 Tax=Paenibacillus cucumis (ex Kampfer et al. 2016) TaxID=1776858 RepID=A0ABS7KKB0_9BACL|nr:hypothetical protein [Paenibacillus cucumis (ex Kampfer et al. 2016)]MBY0204562.1 hypothetical protein [Paenibacillus cucumis (ex Kampfer et al. 2016)]
MKWIWGAAVLVNLAVFIWFLVGATSNFQRSLDLIGMPIMLLCGIPSLIINMISIVVLIRKWNSSLSISTMIYGVIFILILMFCTPAFINALEHTVKPEKVESDPVSLTSDEKYEYNLEIINMSQRNNQVNLIVKEVSNQAVKKTIPLDLDGKEIAAITTHPGSDWQWTVLEPTEEPEIYKLTTTEKLGIHKIYRIDVVEGLSEEMK